MARDEGIFNYGLAIVAVLAGLAVDLWVFLRVVQQEEEHIHEALLEAHKEKSDEHGNNH
jgi:hypothetical protein